MRKALLLISAAAVLLLGITLARTARHRWGEPSVEPAPEVSILEGAPERLADYSALSRNVYRFLPLRLTPEDLDRMHGIDERIGIREYEDAIRIYRQLVIAMAGR